MEEFMTIVDCVWLIGVALSIINIRKNSKFFFVLILLSMIYIMSVNNLSGDESNLYNTYINMQNDINQPYDISFFFFQGICETIAIKLGMSFGWFNFVMNVIAFSLIHCSLKKITDNPSICYLLFILTSLYLDTTLWRQFLGTAILIYSFQYLFVQYSPIKYTFGVLVAALMHSSLILFLIFIFPKIRMKGRKYFCILLPIILLGLTYLNGKQIPLVQTILGLLPGEKADIYANITGQVNNGWLFTVFIWGLFMIISWYITKHTKYVKMADVRTIGVINNMIALSLVLVCFSFMTLIYSRLLRPVSWLLFIEFAIWINNINENNKKINCEAWKVRIQNIIVLILIFIMGYSIVFNHILFAYAEIDAVRHGVPFWSSVF